jgi:uncharacterized protein YdeI (YjbR/CyaY-like superfamily)
MHQNKVTLLAGVVHELPDDMSEAILADEKIAEVWNALTPLARNEWICWTTIVKKAETREEHIHRLGEDLLAGKKRPCCWPGCPHRRESAKKWFKG